MDKNPNHTEPDINLDEIEKNLEKIWKQEIRDYIDEESVADESFPSDRERSRSVQEAENKKATANRYEPETRENTVRKSQTHQQKYEPVKQQTGKIQTKTEEYKGQDNNYNKAKENIKDKEKEKEKQKEKQKDKQKQKDIKKEKRIQNGIQKRKKVQKVQKDKKNIQNKRSIKEDRRESRKEEKEKLWEKTNNQKRMKEEVEDKKSNSHSKGRSGKREEKEEKKKKSGLWRFLKFLLALVMILGILWFLALGIIYGKMEYKPIETLTDQSMKDDSVTNILLIGSDSRSQEEDGRSDAMILLSVSEKTKTFHMTSLLRDMYVEIPGHDGNRLNAAYAFGGAELLLDTVEHNLGIEVNRYAVVNFEAFANLVDAVGGVELELSNEEVQWVNAYLNEYNMLRGVPIETDYLDTTLNGMIHLNGPQALAYSRNRYIGTDFGRTERQRKVLAAVMDRLPSAIIKNPTGLVDGLFTNLTTNLTKNECLRLSLLGGKMLTYEMVQGSIPMEGTYKDANIRGMAVLEVDFEQIRNYIRTAIYGEK